MNHRSGSKNYIGSFKSIESSPKNRVFRLGSVLLSVALLLTTSSCQLAPKASNPTKSSSSSFDPYEPTQSSGVVVSDSRGSWQQIKVSRSNPVFNNKLMSVNRKTSDGKTISTNLTDEDIYSARDWLVNFIATQALDSLAWDSTSGWQTWKKTQAPSFIDATYLAKVLDRPTYARTSESGEVIDRSLVIMNNQSNQFTDGLFRNGTTRITNFGFESGLSANLVSANKNSLAIAGTARANYAVDEKAVIKMAESQGSKINDIKTLHPNLFDGKPEIGHLTFDFSYSLIKETNRTWKISAYQNNFSFSMNGN